MKKKIILFGNGPVARVNYMNLVTDPDYEVAGFTVDRQFIQEETLFDLPLVPFEEVTAVFPPAEYAMHIAIGYVKLNKVRAERYYQAKELGYELTSHVSVKAIVSPDLKIGDNTVIGANCVISPMVTIGNNVTIAAGAFIAHDTVIKDHCFIGNCVAIAGSVTIEPYCFLGIHATIRNKVTIARECVIGAGALILQDTKEREVYMGEPADLLPISSDELSIS